MNLKLQVFTKISRIFYLFALSYLIVSFNTDCTNQKVISITKKIIIVNNNHCYTPIIIPQNATEKTVEAANTLAEYIYKIAGVKPNIITNLQGNSPSSAIWIGHHPQLNNLFPKIDFNFKYPEEIIISATTKHLVILGRDIVHNLPNKNIQLEYGTSNAVYTFLQQYMGVRWLWPGELGEEYPHQNTISFSPFLYRYHPQIRARSGLFPKFNMKIRKQQDPISIWSKRQRNQLSSLYFYGGHGFSDWWGKYHVSNPEFFALQESNKRELVDLPKRAKLCQSNPAVWNQWLLEVEQILQENPYQTIFNVSPNDGHNKGHCTCNNCKSWDTKDMTVEDYSISDRHVRFANELATLLKKKYPKKNYYVQLNAYGLSLPPPIKEKPLDNVIISCVANFHLRGDGVADHRSLHKEYYKNWGGLTNNLFWRPNMGNPVGQYWGLPDVAMHQAGEDIKFVEKNGCHGLYIDLYWGHWGTQAPQYYILSQLVWDPSLNTDTILVDFYKSAYGIVWKEMKVYWTFLEDTRNQFISTELNKYRAFNLSDKYNQKWFNQAFQLLAIAEEKLKYANNPKYLKRVLFAKQGLIYTQKVVKIRKTMRDEFEKNPTPKNRELVLRLWEEMDAHKKTMPKYCINFNAVFKKPENKRMLGLHPDNPLGRRQKWLLKQEAGLE